MTLLKSMEHVEHVWFVKFWIYESSEHDGTCELTMQTIRRFLDKLKP